MAENGTLPWPRVSLSSTITLGNSHGAASLSVGDLAYVIGGRTTALSRRRLGAALGGDGRDPSCTER